jgi:putative DNA primase/helicase
MRDLAGQLRAAIQAAGLVPPETVVADGRIHRFPSSGIRGDDAGWYVLHDGQFPAGSFGCFREGKSEKFKPDSANPVSAEDLATAAATRALIEQARAEEAERAAVRAAELWESAPEAESHPYLSAKAIPPCGARLDGDRLLVPMIDGNGEVRSVQRIAPDGSKRFYYGAPVKGLHCPIGQPTQKIYLAEGFATAASIHAATGCRAVAAFSAGNLPEVARTIRTIKPDAAIFAVADNDPHGVGLRQASAAAEAVGGRVLQIPPGYGDANDYAAAGQDLGALLFGKKKFLISFEEFTREPRPIRWLIRDLVPAESLMMVFGPSGGGKTFVVLDWALSIASRLPDWQGAKVRGGPVVYLAGEGHAGLTLRAAAWKNHHQLQRFENAWISQAGCDLNTAAGLQLARESILEVGAKPAFVIVDTVHRFLRGDENSTEDVGEMVKACNALQQEFGCTVLLVHHTGHGDQDRERGSSSWRGALEANVLVRPGNGGIQAIRKKMKDIELDETPIPLELQPVDIPGWIDEDGEQVRSAVVIAGSQVATAKTDNKMAEFRNILQNACIDSRCEFVNDAPYITTSALRQYLGTIYSPAMLRKHMMTNSTEINKRYFLADLLRAKDITPHEGGYIVENSTVATAIRIILAAG